MTIVQELQTQAAAAVAATYDIAVSPETFVVQETRREFEGDFTLVVFPLTKYKLGSPDQIGQKLGELLKARMPEIESHNTIKGFLNLKLSDAYWCEFLAKNWDDAGYTRNTHGEGKRIVVEYCSPNTNKPLHLGHLRNIVLGYALTEVLKANGYDTIPTCLFNDRGTNISKSMYAWLLDGKQATPESLGKRGDKLVGDYYVMYANRHKAEVKALMEEGLSEEEAEKQALTSQAIQEMTVKWENGDPDVRALWSRMNGWVYASMEQTFQRLGVRFERYYYESGIYQLGKETVTEGLEKGIFFQKADGSVWIDLAEDGLDQKLVLRKDGTSVYITQDLAVADEKYRDFAMDKSIYVVGNEQEYHFKVLFLILRKLGKSYSDGLYHLSYGMVDLPSGKMKSREGTTVEADDLMDEMEETARQATEELGKTEGMREEELQSLHRNIGLSALKFFLVKVDPKKRILFDPKESIDIHGHTGPFVQYAYTRTAALKRKAAEVAPFASGMAPEDTLNENERILLRKLFQYSTVLKDAGDTYNPALIANYAYELAKDFNRFYQGDKIIQSERPHTSSFRLALSLLTGRVMKDAMALLGIEMPERM